MFDKIQYAKARVIAFVKGLKFICHRCESDIEFSEVSPGYFGACPDCYEDVYKIETRLVRR